MRIETRYISDSGQSYANEQEALREDKRHAQERKEQQLAIEELKRYNTWDIRYRRGDDGSWESYRVHRCLSGVLSSVD